ncbi:tetratricopeptide repeat protein [Vicingus serpentipes]|uniref:Tetratricopeptide repeat protein n=1 Tax=Vicingus serpentipes TaxID=1926625 RepID=A0A5C6RPE4_9FLAO|nr:tetratricopeptide repeat protein [Vicingus serpentipes]TXB64201.1 tetratricopeptide repeat protein [Vicingus serpentipes]
MKLNLSTFTIRKIYILFTILVFVIYGNSINNEYALDDNIVVDGNKLVEGGIAALPEIFTSRYSTDDKQSYDYRPVVIASFAIEKQFFNKLPPFQTKEQKKKKDKLTQANISHFVNVLLYALTGVILLIVLQKILYEQSIIVPLAITLLFMLHPLHTEVVSSIKNRDEIIVFFMVLLSINNFIKYTQQAEIRYLVYALLCMIIALFTKNTAMIIAPLVPMTLYFIKAQKKYFTISIISILVFFVAIKITQKMLVDGENQLRLFKYFEHPLMHEPWSMKRISSSLYCNWFYFKSLIFPKDMAFYYGYNQIPIATWSFWQVWVSLFITLGGGFYGLYSFLKREYLGLGILICLGVMMGVNNSLILLPGIVADRFTYMLSLGFCIVLVWGISKILKLDFSEIKNHNHKIPTKFLWTILVIGLFYSGRTIARNPDWHDYLTLYEHDIDYVSESAKAHALIANTYYTQVAREFKKNPGNPSLGKDVQKLIYHYKEAVRIDTTYYTSLNNLGSVYLNFKRDYSSAIKYCEKALIYNSNYVEAYFNLAFSYNAIGNYDASITNIKKIIEIKPDYLNVYDLLNSVLTKNNKTIEGIELLNDLAEESVRPKFIYVNIGNLYSSLGDGYYDVALDYFVKAYQEDNSDIQLCNHILVLSNRLGKQNIYQEYLKYCK